MRTASIRLDVSPGDAAALTCPRAAHADACNRLIPFVRAHRLRNRVGGLHRRAYTMLRGKRDGCLANHETSIGKIAMEDLTHIRSCVKAGKRMRGRPHCWT